MLAFQPLFLPSFFLSPRLQAATRAHEHDIESLAALSIICAATATSRDRAEKLESVLTKPLEGNDAAPSMAAVYCASLRALAHLGTHFPFMTAITADLLRRFLFDPSPLLVALARHNSPYRARDFGHGGRESKDEWDGTHQTHRSSAAGARVADRVSSAAIDGLIRLTCLEGQQQQQNAGMALVSSVTLVQRTVEDAEAEARAEAETANGDSHDDSEHDSVEQQREKLLVRNGVRVMAAVAEAVAATEPDAVTQAAAALYQRLAAGPSLLDTETLHALVRVGTAGPTAAFDSVCDMLLSLALQMLDASAHTGEGENERDRYHYLERDDALATALVTLFAAVPKACLAVRETEWTVWVFVGVEW